FTVPAGLGVQLRALLLTGLEFHNADLTTSVTRAPGGDGLVHIGRIIAGDLGRVTIRGDLGAINCGDTNMSTPAIQLLQVGSMGRFGLVTQGGGDLTSNIKGTLVALHVTGDILRTHLEVTNIGSLVVGGSLVGGADPASGFIQADRIGTIRI